jgi:coenzyme F420-reducing hydrogenase delta subunit
VPCKWHPLTAIENALKDGFRYDAETVVLPVTCTGLVKVSYLLKLFAKGMRGVLVLGCDEGDCRYYNGSARCARIVEETREILDLAGIAPDRLQFHAIAESGGREAKRVLKGFLKQFGKVAAKASGGNGGGKRKAVRSGKRVRPKKAEKAAGAKKVKSKAATGESKSKKTARKPTVTRKAKKSRNTKRTTKKKSARTSGKRRTTGRG